MMSLAICIVIFGLIAIVNKMIFKYYNILSLTSLNLSKYGFASSYLVKHELYRLNSLHLSC